MKRKVYSRARVREVVLCACDKRATAEFCKPGVITPVLYSTYCTYTYSRSLTDLNDGWYRELVKYEKKTIPPRRARTRSREYTFGVAL